MKRIFFILLVCTASTLVSAQKHNIVNASIALKNTNYAEAKIYIDEALANETTSNEAKMWNYRSKIYLDIQKKQPELDADAIFKATQAYVKCMGRDKKGRVIVRKWTSEEDVMSGLINCGYILFNTAIDKYNTKDYSASIKYYNAIFDIIPFDKDSLLEKGNISKETILYNSFFSSNKMKDNDKSKAALSELMNINFNEPSIYIHMSNIYLEEENTDKALEYLELGRSKFKGNQSLLNTEINLYIQLERTTELIGKFSEALELDPQNHLLLFNRATIYDQNGEFTSAEKDYQASLAINPHVFGTNYNLGALYFNSGVATNDEANGTSNNNTYKRLKSQAENSFDKALPYLELAYDLNSEDRNTLLSLKQLYYLKGDYKKSENMKKLIEGLK